MRVTRKFNVPDAKVLEQTEIVISEFPKDQKDFEAFDKSFTPDVTHKLSGFVKKVTNTGTDSIIVDEQAEITKSTVDALNKCNLCHKTIIYFAKKSFKKNIQVLSQFGINDASKVKNKQGDMVFFMKTHEAVILKYADELKAAGCSQEQIDAYSESWKELEAANVNQETKKLSRNSMTAKRVEALNELHENLKLINDAAKIIYSDDPIRLQKYTVPRMKSATDSPEDIVE